MMPPRATIGTPRNDVIVGCARGHQPRKRGSWRMSTVRYGRSDSSIAPSSPCVRGSGPIAATSSSVMPDGDEALEGALAVGDPDRRVPRPGELARRVDEALQHGLDRALGGDREHGVAHRLQRRGLARIAHPADLTALRRLCRRLLQLDRDDPDRLDRAVASVGLRGADLVDHVVPVADLAEDRVLAVEPRARPRS